MRAPALLAGLSLLLAGCSLTVAAGVEECRTSEDCGQGRVCREGFCLPQPLGCGERFGSTSPTAIPLGALVPLSTDLTPDGGLDMSDQQALNAALLAIEEANQRRLGGSELTLYLCDTAGDPARTREQAAWLADDKKVAAVLTAGSSQTLAAAEVTIPRGVLTLSYSASSPELSRMPDTNGGTVGLLWRTSPSDVIQGRVIADLLLEDARFSPATKVAIFYVDDQYGQGLTSIISERLASAGREQRSIFYKRRGDVSGPLEQLAAFAPQRTVLIGFNDDVGRILKLGATLPSLQRPEHQWLFTDSVKDGALLEDATVRSLIDGLYGTGPAQGAGLAFGAFRDRFLTRYNADPAFYAYTANAYDAMFLLAVAATHAHATSGGQVTGASMAEVLGRLSGSGQAYQVTPSQFTDIISELTAGRPVNLEGASGKLDFDSNGDTAAPIELWQVEGAGFRTVSTLEPRP